LNKINPPFQKVGKIKEAHGLKGEVFVFVFSGEIAWSSKISQAQIQAPDGTLSLFHIESSRPHKGGLILKFKEVSDRNQSEALKGALFLIPSEALVSDQGETIYLGEVLGFEVCLKGNPVGFVEDFSTNGFQDLLVVRTDNHSFEVPFVAEFIIQIDFSNKKLFMDFPEDLMTLNKIN
jgi:16S rRNA processing protein RimM